MYTIFLRISSNLSAPILSLRKEENHPSHGMVVSSVGIDGASTLEAAAAPAAGLAAAEVAALATAFSARASVRIIAAVLLRAT